MRGRAASWDSAALRLTVRAERRLARSRAARLLDRGGAPACGAVLGLLIVGIMAVPLAHVTDYGENGRRETAVVAENCNEHTARCLASWPTGSGDLDTQFARVSLGQRVAVVVRPATPDEALLASQLPVKEAAFGGLFATGLFAIGAGCWLARRGA